MYNWLENEGLSFHAAHKISSNLEKKLGADRFFFHLKQELPSLGRCIHSYIPCFQWAGCAISVVVVAAVLRCWPQGGPLLLRPSASFWTVTRRPSFPDCVHAAAAVVILWGDGGCCWRRWPWRRRSARPCRLLTWQTEEEGRQQGPGTYSTFPRVFQQVGISQDTFTHEGFVLLSATFFSLNSFEHHSFCTYNQSLICLWTNSFFHQLFFKPKICSHLEQETTHISWTSIGFPLEGCRMEQ